MKQIIGLICLALSFTAVSAQQCLYNKGATIYVTGDGYVNIVGTDDDPADFITGEGGITHNEGLIYLYGDFENLTPAGGDNPFAYPKGGVGGVHFENSTLIMLGDSIQRFRGTPTRFNDLWLKNITENFANPKTQYTDAYIDTPNKLRIDGTELSTCEAGGLGCRMIVLNTDPTAVEAPQVGFVSADDDNGNTDAHVAQYRGGRLEWYIQDNPNALYVFPVGHKSLPQIRRDVTIRTNTSELRKFMVRCVAKDPQNDNYIFNNASPDSFVCALNEHFYHIIQDSSDNEMDTTRTYADLRIDYIDGTDGVFDDVGLFDENGDNPQWKALFAESFDGQRGFKYYERKGWSDFWYPVFALYPVSPFKGLYLTNETRPGSQVFRVKDVIKLEDNQDNRDGFDYLWTMEYRGNPPQIDQVGTTPNRYAEYPKDFGIDQSPRTPGLKPGKYCFTLRVKNPAIEDCTVEQETCITLLPSRAVYIPTAFSPNGDAFNQVHTSWFYGFREVTVDIYNRWGKLIFTGTYDKKDGVDSEVGVPLWLGRTNAGDPVPEGSYVYRVRMFVDDVVPPIESSDEIDKVWEQTGMITVIY